MIVLGFVGQSRERAEVGIAQAFSRLDVDDRALSSYGLPCHSPFQVIGLPFLKSLETFVPNMYCLMALGSTSASHTRDLGALRSASALAIRLRFIRGSSKSVLHGSLGRHSSLRKGLRSSSSFTYSSMPPRSRARYSSTAR